MRVIKVKSCSKCPYFEETSGYYQVWVCRHRMFRGGHNDPRNINGKILASGGYPKDASIRVAKGCPLEKATKKGELL
jgi:hypothetical protein